MISRRLRPLSRLRPGQSARIAALGGGREFQARLVSMGLLIGTSITVIRASGALYGAALIAVGPMRLGIGRGMAEKILVTVERHLRVGTADVPTAGCARPGEINAGGRSAKGPKK